jgi:hypothetical protein
VIDREATKTVAVTAGIAAAQIATQALQMQAATQAGAFAAIQTRISCSAMMGGWF